MISKQQIEESYKIIENNDCLEFRQECSLRGWRFIKKKYNIKSQTIIRDFFKNNILRTKKDIKAGRKLTSIELYGVDDPMKSPIIQNKVKETSKKRFGVERYAKTQEFKIIMNNRWNNTTQEDLEKLNQKKKETCLKKYGVDNVAKDKNVRLKLKTNHIANNNITRDIWLSKIKNAWKNKTQEELNEIKSKRTFKVEELYGVKNAFQSEIIKNKIKQTNLIKYQSENPMGNTEIRSKVAKSSKRSQLEKRCEEFLLNNNFIYVSQYYIKNIICGVEKTHLFDFAIFNSKEELLMLIDCDGMYYHNYINDVDGKTVNNYTDDFRSMLVPDGVRFVVIVEGKESESQGYKQILKLLNIDYEQYKQDIFNWCRQFDFPYPNIENPQEIYINLCKANPNKFSTKSRIGDRIILKYHKSLWKAHRKNFISPYDAWHNDELIKKCIDNRIIYKGHNLDPSKVLSGFTIAKIAPKVSIFNPYLAKYLVNKYLNKYSTIFDCCSGYSGRMLGVCSLDKHYIGIDINEFVVNESNQIIEDLQLDAKISNSDILLCETQEYDCLFTCPPYEDIENWNTDIANKSCDEWIDLILSKFKCKDYLFVVNKTIKYKEFVVEKLLNDSHFGKNEELVLHINNTQ